MPKHGLHTFTDMGTVAAIASSIKNEGKTTLVRSIYDSTCFCDVTCGPTNDERPIHSVLARVRCHCCYARTLSESVCTHACKHDAMLPQRKMFLCVHMKDGATRNIEFPLTSSRGHHTPWTLTQAACECPMHCMPPHTRNSPTRTSWCIPKIHTHRIQLFVRLRCVHVFGHCLHTCMFNSCNVSNTHIFPLCPRSTFSICQTFFRLHIEQHTTRTHTDTG
jgi:hypothetical protein